MHFTTALKPDWGDDLNSVKQRRGWQGNTTTGNTFSTWVEDVDILNYSIWLKLCNTGNMWVNLFLKLCSSTRVCKMSIDEHQMTSFSHVLLLSVNIWNSARCSTRVKCYMCVLKGKKNWDKETMIPSHCNKCYRRSDSTNSCTINLYLNQILSAFLQKVAQMPGIYCCCYCWPKIQLWLEASQQTLLNREMNLV